MNLRLPGVEFCIVSFSGGIRNIEYTRFGFKGQPCPDSKEIVFLIQAGRLIHRETEICKTEEVRIQPDNVPVFEAGDSILGSKNAFLIKTPE